MSIKSLSWYILPTLSVFLLLPTLLSCLTFLALVCYELIVRDMQGTLLLAVLNAFSPRLFVVAILVIPFGPVFACLLCIGQLGHPASASSSTNSAQRTAKAVLILALSSLGLLLLAVMIGGLLRGGT